MGKALGRVVNTALSPITKGPLGETLFGKEDPGTAASQVNIYTPEQQDLLKKSTEQYGTMLDQNKHMADVNGVNMENQARSGVEDQARKAGELVAQHGLQNSSIGLSAMLNPYKELGNKIESIRANQPGMQLENLNKINGGIGNLLGAQSGGTIYNKAQASQGRLPGGIASTLLEGGKMFMGGKK